MDAEGRKLYQAAATGGPDERAALKRYLERIGWFEELRDITTVLLAKDDDGIVEPNGLYLRTTTQRGPFLSHTTTEIDWDDDAAINYGGFLHDPTGANPERVTVIEEKAVVRVQFLARFERMPQTQGASIHHWRSDGMLVDRQMVRGFPGCWGVFRTEQGDYFTASVYQESPWTLDIMPRASFNFHILKLGT